MTSTRPPIHQFTILRYPSARKSRFCQGDTLFSCLTSTVWLDVVFLFDASKATGQNNLNNMWGFIASMLDFYTVQKSGYTGNVSVYSRTRFERDLASSRLARLASPFVSRKPVEYAPVTVFFSEFLYPSRDSHVRQPGHGVQAAGIYQS